MDTVPFSDFQKLDIRTGTIIEATVPAGSEKLVRLVIDCGSELGNRIIFAGLKKYYAPEDLIGRHVIVVLNLEPRTFMGEEGQGMLLAADDEATPVLLQPEKPVKNGISIR